MKKLDKLYTVNPREDIFKTCLSNEPKQRKNELINTELILKASR